MSIQDFYAAAQNMEFSRDFQFRVRSLGPFTEDDLLYLTTANLPGKTIANHQVPYMGLDFNIPGAVKYEGSDAWDVNFRLDEGLNIRNKFENWIEEIFSDETSTGKYGVPVERAVMDILGKNMETLRRYEFIGMYIKSIAPVTYDIKGEGEPREFDATLAYQFWRLVGA